MTAPRQFTLRGSKFIESDSPITQPWMPGTALLVNGFICLPLSPLICLLAWMHGTALWVDEFRCPNLDASGRTGSFPPLSLHLSRIVFHPGCLTRLSGWADLFVSLCLPSLVSCCLPARVPGTAFWAHGFMICLPAWIFVVSQPGCSLVDGLICRPSGFARTPLLPTSGPP